MTAYFMCLVAVDIDTNRVSKPDMTIQMFTSLNPKFNRSVMVSANRLSPLNRCMNKIKSNQLTCHRSKTGQNILSRGGRLARQPYQANHTP